MKHKISRILCTALCCAPLLASAQTSEKSTSPKRLYQEGQTLFQQKAYAAAISPLQAYVRQMNADGKPLPDTGERQEAEYMLVCAAYELRDPKSIDLLRAFLDEYPDTPHANRIYALIASSYFFEGNYDDALAMFNSARLDLLGTEERDDMTYRLATCYLKTGNVKEAAIWFETLRSTSRKYAADCAYYISYIRYTQGRYDEALSGFLPLQDNAKYKDLVPYYIAEIYLVEETVRQGGNCSAKCFVGPPRRSELHAHGGAEPHPRYSRIPFREISRSHKVLRAIPGAQCRICHS